MTTVAVRPPPPSLGLEVHLWRAELDDSDWPRAKGLPATEHERAERILSATRRGRWVASRWALRTALAGYLEEDPAAIELRVEQRGKPRLATESPLRFNLSHSSNLAVVAVALDREVGVDVERIGERPLAFYENWVRREAIAKCLGIGLGEAESSGDVAVSRIDVGLDFKAALALASDGAVSARLFDLRPGD